jgi:hypothetical protein
LRSRQRRINSNCLGANNRCRHFDNQSIRCCCDCDRQGDFSGRNRDCRQDFDPESARNRNNRSSDRPADVDQTGADRNDQADEYRDPTDGD